MSELLRCKKTASCDSLQTVACVTKCRSCQVTLVRASRTLQSASHARSSLSVCGRKLDPED